MTVSRRGMAVAIALGLILAVALALPITGCKKAAGPSEEPVVIGVGQDPGTGDEFGAWGAWNSVPLAGQRYKYDILAYTNASQTYPLSPAGWLELTFTDAGDGSLAVAYSGSDSAAGFSGEGLYVPQEGELANAWVMSALGSEEVVLGQPNPQQLVMALTMPAHSLDTRGLPGAAQHTWTVGETWFEAGAGAGSLQTFVITGKRAFAGVTGAFGEYLADYGAGRELAEFCVNPNVALPLYLKLTSGQRVNFECVLTEYSGPARTGESAVGSGAAGGNAPTGGGEIGQDPGKGNELGPWADWNTTPAVGQRYEYSLAVSGGQSRPESSVAFTFSDAKGEGGAEVKVTYAGNAFGRDFSGEDCLWFDWGSWTWAVTDPTARSTLAGLLGPASYLGASSPVDVGQHTWATGQRWTHTDLGGTVTFDLTGKKAFAGITGVWGKYTEAYGHIPALVTEFCVNPNVPLPLYVRTTFGEGVLFESALTQYSSRYAVGDPSSPSSGPSSSGSSSSSTFNGIWVQKDDNGVTGYYAWLFEDGYVYLGLKGCSRDEIYDDDYGLRGASDSDKKGIPFRVEASAIILSMPDGQEMTWRTSGTTFWFGTGEIALESTSGVQGPNLKSVSLDGEYVPE